MATEAQINAVVDAVVEAFEGNPALFKAFLERAKLETEFRAIESEIRRAEVSEHAQSTAYQVAYTELETRLAAKQAEIDALT